MLPENQGNSLGEHEKLTELLRKAEIESKKKRLADGGHSNESVRYASSKDLKELSQLLGVFAQDMDAKIKALSTGDSKAPLIHTSTSIEGKNVQIQDQDSKVKLTINDDGSAHVAQTGVVSTNNSTTTALGSSETYTGTGEQNDYPHVGVMVKTDNSGTLYFDFSNDGTNWDSTYPVNGFGVASGVSEFHTAVKLGRYFRVRLVNDSGAQSYLRLTTYYGNGFVPSVAPLNQTAGLDQDAIFTRSTVPQDEIRLGRRTGVTGWNKFGYRTTLTAANGEETIWAASGNYTIPTSADTFNIAYDGTSGGSTDGAGFTGARALTFYYIDSSGLPATATHTLGTDGTDTTSFSGLGINRIAVSSTGSATYNNAAITVTHTSSGNTMAFIPAQESVTQQCIFHVGSNHTAVAKFLKFNVNKLAGSNPKVTVKGYVYNRGIATRFEIFRHIIDTQSENTVTFIDPIGFNLNATDVLYFVADTDQNNTVITLRFSLNEYQNI